MSTNNAVPDCWATYGIVTPDTPDDGNDDNNNGGNNGGSRRSQTFYVSSFNFLSTIFFLLISCQSESHVVVVQQLKKIFEEGKDCFSVFSLIFPPRISSYVVCVHY